MQMQIFCNNWPKNKPEWSKRLASFQQRKYVADYSSMVSHVWHLQRYHAQNGLPLVNSNRRLVGVHLVTEQQGMLNSHRKSQNEILSHLAQASSSIPSLDLDHTWAQAPVKFEDALCRRFLIPSEYDWDVSLSNPLVIHAYLPRTNWLRRHPSKL
jgi:hypothetical protein